MARMQTSLFRILAASASILFVTVNQASAAEQDVPAPSSMSKASPQYEIYRNGYLAGYRVGYGKALTRDIHNLDTNTVEREGQKSPFGLSASWKTSAGTEAVNSMSLRFTPSYKFTDKLKLSARVGVNVGFANQNRATAENARIVGSWSGVALGEMTKFNMSGEWHVPLSVAARESESVRSRLLAIPKLDFDMSKAGIKNLETYFLLAFTRSFHGLTTSVDGTPNQPYSLGPEVGFGYQISKPLAFSAGFARPVAWDYSGVLTSSFEHYQELDVQISPQLMLALGHANSGPIGNGQGVTFISDAGSELFGILSYTF